MPIELEGETRVTTDLPESGETSASVPVLTILAHPDPRRVGERLLLRVLTIGREVLISRTEPVFDRMPETDRRMDGALPLGGRYLSRQPMRLLPASEPGGIVLDLSTTRTKVEAEGEVAAGEVVFSSRQVDAGVLLNLANKIVLLLHRTTLPTSRDTALPSFGLVGDGSAMVHLRREIRRLAPLDVSVLLRG